MATFTPSYNLHLQKRWQTEKALMWRWKAKLLLPWFMLQTEHRVVSLHGSHSISTHMTHTPSSTGNYTTKKEVLIYMSTLKVKHVFQATVGLTDQQHYNHFTLSYLKLKAEPWYEFCNYTLFPLVNYRAECIFTSMHHTSTGAEWKSNDIPQLLIKLLRYYPRASWTQGR